MWSPNRIWLIVRNDPFLTYHRPVGGYTACFNDLGYYFIGSNLKTSDYGLPQIRTRSYGIALHRDMCNMGTEADENMFKKIFNETLDASKIQCVSIDCLVFADNDPYVVGEFERLSQQETNLNPTIDQTWKERHTQ